MKKVAGYVTAIAGMEIVSGVIGYLTRPEIDGWYKTLVKSALTPPNMLFPIVWTILYALVGASAYRTAVLPAGPAKKQAVMLFAVYMLLNWSWSFVFFTQKMLLAGFVQILLMTALNLVLVLKLNKLDDWAGKLLLPLMAWTTFACYLSGFIYFNN